MSTNLVIPNLGDSISEATLLRWIKNEGDYVQNGDAVAEFETDKANTELTATASGILHPSRAVGFVAKIGDVVGQIEESAKPSAAARPMQSDAPVASSNGGVTAPSAAPPAATPKPVAAQPEAKAKVSTEDLSPSVRRMVEENKVDPATVSPTGPGGRILKEDVQRVLDNPPASDNGKAATAAPTKTEATVKAEPPAAAPEPIAKPGPAPAPRTTPAVGRPPGVDTSKPTGEVKPIYDANGIARVPMTKIRKRIAINLVQAQHTAAILTTFNEIDLTGVSELRSKYKEKFEKTFGVGLGFMSFFARAVVLGLREFPRVNAFMDGDDVLYHNYVNLGVAVSTERGLTVPVLHGVDQMSFAKIESEIKRLAVASREGKLGIQELSGGTFTITNGGVFGSLLSTPILNPPQSGILGMHAIQKRPVAIGDKIEIRPMMYVALSYDHRIVDGRESVSFLVRVKEYLEDPARLMLEV